MSAVQDRAVQARTERVQPTGTTTGQVAAGLSGLDAVLLLSFGGPESEAEVMPFLERVVAGRGVPHERLVEVSHHYLARGGVSPINAANRDLLARLREALAQRGLDLPVAWGNRNSPPYVLDALHELLDVADPPQRIRVVATSAYPSYSGCRQYREDLAVALAALTEQGRPMPAVDLIDNLCRTSGFVDANVDACRAALAGLTSEGPVRVLFVTHSIPLAMQENSGPGGNGYVQTHLEVAEQVMAQLAGGDGAPLDPRVAGWELVYCSRSGPPSQPWLEPDVGDRIRELAEQGVAGVLVVPIGFVSDHMEVVHDLDTEAAEIAAEAGLSFARAATAGTHPRFIDAVLELLDGPAKDCPVGCCANLRDPSRPAAAGQGWPPAAADAR